MYRFVLLLFLVNAQCHFMDLCQKIDQLNFKTGLQIEKIEENLYTSTSGN